MLGLHSLHGMLQLLGLPAVLLQLLHIYRKGQEGQGMRWKERGEREGRHVEAGLLPYHVLLHAHHGSPALGATWGEVGGQ